MKSRVASIIKGFAFAALFSMQPAYALVIDEFTDAQFNIAVNPNTLGPVPNAISDERTLFSTSGSIFVGDGQLFIDLGLSPGSGLITYTGAGNTDTISPDVSA